MTDTRMAESNYDGALSQAGRVRADAMLTSLTAHMQRTHRNRRARRRAATIAAPTLLAVAAVALMRFPSRSPRSDTSPAPRVIARAEPTGPLITIVRSNASIVEQVAISDNQLLDTLAAMDRPVGLVRSGDRVWLTRDVTDDQTTQGG